LYSGSSPALPLVLACLILFCFSVFQLRQYALAGLGRPRLKIASGDPPSGYGVKFKSAYDSIERQISAPWSLEGHRVFVRILAAASFVAFWFIIAGQSIDAFELWPYNALLLAAIVAILVCLAMKWYDLLKLWDCLRKLLKLIQILPLLPAIRRIAEEWPKRPIWEFNRSVSREAVEREMLYRLHRRGILRKEMQVELFQTRTAGVGTSRGTTQLRSAHIGAHLPDTAGVNSGLIKLGELVFGKTLLKPDGSGQPRLREILAGKADPGAYNLLKDIERREIFCADAAAKIYDMDLRPLWRTSLDEEAGVAPNAGKSDSPRDGYVVCCADFVALQYCHFIAYAAAHVKRLATSLSLGFVLLALLFNAYSPQGSQLIARSLAVLFLVIGAAFWRVFSQMERDPILSAIAHTDAGELNGEFWVQLLALGGLPLLGVLAHLFPSATQFLFQWIAPSVQAIH
jgi:hypothetical protein